MNRLSLVAIDDEPMVTQAVKDALAELDLEIHTANDPLVGLEAVFSVKAKIVILDLNMPGKHGMEVLKEIVERQPETDVFLLTADYSPESAVQAVKLGAADYLTKPLQVSKLRERVQESIQRWKQSVHADELESELLESSSFEGLIGRSPLMLELFARIVRVAPHYRTVLISGDTGTGKELVARALHRLSPVASGPFAVCNCSAIVETLFESELFGYVKGAFTGATQDKLGIFEYANGGSVFLDEIGETPLPVQAKLLRVLQNQEVQRVGSPATRKVNVRVIAATNRELRAMVAEKAFREDLYYRLSMVELSLPRLADRKEDLPLLQRHLVKSFAAQYGKEIAGLTRRAQAFLARHTWPGNVRELENVLGNACMMVQGTMIDLADLPTHLQGKAGASAEDDFLSLEELQRRHLLRVLERVGGDKSRAAEILGISRSTLYSMLSRIDDKQRSPAQSRF